MPLTPYHLGPGLFIGEIFEKQINLVSILLASVLVDTRAVYCFFYGNCRLHGLIHTFAGSAFLAFFITIGVYYFRKRLKRITNLFRIRNNYSFSSILLGSLLGVGVHLILDSVMHSDMTPFWPMTPNPLLGLVSDKINYSFCAFTMAIGLIIYAYKFIIRTKHSTEL